MLQYSSFHSSLVVVDVGTAGQVFVQWLCMEWECEQSLGLSIKCSHLFLV